MRCCRATPSCGDEETSVVAARSGLCGWGGALICNAVSKQTERWTNGNGSAVAGVHKSDEDVADVAGETVYRHNNNNCSSSSNSSAEGMRSAHCVLPQQQQEQRRRQSTSGWRSSNHRYSLLRCILCNLKQSNTQSQQQQQQQQQQQHTKAHANQLLQVQTHAQRSRQQQSQQSQSQPQAIVVAVVVGASIDHQIQQQEPQLSDHLNVKQHRQTTAGGGDGKSNSGRSSRASSSYSCADEGGHIGGSEALL
ncbi:putative uncharacterized protein DDB_G0271606 [Zeugodacus cucurbitae]|uniref:putative uncharacterized protein DDB_G0271606 n=1 Tax=Zeugodacus cucurbitae TaxID=28588 RepID=UPI0010A7484F|nr:putative uncharacterized protein DDB_G0271606 [Zeugodacus cucurbitae]